MTDAMVDHYGYAIAVQPLMGSIGPCVDLEWEDEAGNGSFRLTPRQALELADLLKEAAHAKC